MDYRASLDWIYSFTNFEVTPATQYGAKTFDLTRMERLLAALGDPHKQFQAIHVAGTKGKGSTAALIESVLRAAKYRTGLYTSPHLHTFRERIRVNGELIERDDLVAGVEKLQPLAAEISGLTAFELMTALAFDYFRARGVEMAVLEVGLGGRLDATNVVLPRVAVIASISYDHTAILGNTLTEIAREKAGIIKPSVPVVVAPQQDEAFRAIVQVAKDKNAPLIAVNYDLSFQVSGLKFQIAPIEIGLDSQRIVIKRVADSNLKLLTLNLKLLGRHQLANAATALAAIEILRERGIEIPDAAVRDGLANVEWHGRFEILGQDPFVVVDGAHNADSARQLIETLRALFPHTPIHLIFGASNDKDIEGMLRELLPNAAALILTRSRNPRAADPARLSELAAKYNVETSIAPDVATALRDAHRRARGNNVICATGSLFVVAEAREAWFIEHDRSVEKDS